MKFDRRKHHRTSTRMQGFDYSLAGAYFVTLVTFQRSVLFGEIKDGEMCLNRRGEIVKKEWFASAGIRQEIRLYPEEFVVMPNHIHGIVWIAESNKSLVDVGANGRSPLRMKPRSLSSFVAGFKSSVTKQIRLEFNETSIWQRNYHDRIIRNERELDAILKYIEVNPLNWPQDDEHPVG